MTKIELKQRRERPAEPFSLKFQATLLDFTSEFLKSQSFKHALTKGENREAPVLDFFQNNLPGNYAVVRGEAVDLFERHSPQLDLMVYDKIRNFAFYSGESVVLPAEALLVSMEVKSVLNVEELKKSLVAAAKLRKLKPFKEPLSPPHKTKEPSANICRYLHCLFAYGSDLAEGPDWLEREYSRYARVLTDSESPVAEIDRIYVANRGLLNPVYNFGIAEDPEEGIALLHFYMDILNFLQRENRRRPTVPYIAYAGRIGKRWEKLDKSI
jgi:hypothetical protein